MFQNYSTSRARAYSYYYYYDFLYSFPRFCWT